MNSEELQVLAEAEELGFSDGYDGNARVTVKPDSVPEELWQAWKAAYDGGHVDGVRAYRRQFE